MGCLVHMDANLTLNVYTQVLDDSRRAAVDRDGNELFTIVHSGQGARMNLKGLARHWTISTTG